MVLFIILVGVGVVYGESPDTNQPLPSGDNSLEIKTQIPSFPINTYAGNKGVQDVLNNPLSATDVTQVI